MTIETMLKTATQYWPHIAPLMIPIGGERQYRKAVRFLDAILDAGGADETHPLASLAELIGERIAEYEEEHKPISEISGVALIKELMKEHGLRQSDLPEIGPQSVVSLVLSGRRKLNGDQIIKLSKRFGVPIDALLE